MTQVFQLFIVGGLILYILGGVSGDTQRILSPPFFSKRDGQKYWWRQYDALKKLVAFFVVETVKWTWSSWSIGLNDNQWSGK